MYTPARRRLARLSVLGVLAAVPLAATAGPLLICHPFDAGDAALLPWGKGRGWNTPEPSYDVHRLTGDTLRLLSAGAPVLGRMENLRRATVYARQDREVAWELLAAVLGRALAAAAEGSRDPLPWFDAAYLVEAYRQQELALAGNAPGRPPWFPIAPEMPDGHRLVLKALELGGPSPEMEYAASLMTKGSVAAEHRRRASSGAKAGSLLAKNLSR